jgi:hypothetical protein
MKIIQRETVVSWHCHGYLYYWRCHSRPKGGRRPYRVTGELRRLMFQLYSENPIWGAGRIHGELQKLGHKVSRSSVHQYLKRYPPRPPPGWRTFLQNHMQNAAPIGFFVVAAMLFKLLHTMIIVGLNYTGILRENIRTSQEAKVFGSWPSHMIKSQGRRCGHKLSQGRQRYRYSSTHQNKAKSCSLNS